MWKHINKLDKFIYIYIPSESAINVYVSLCLNQVISYIFHSAMAMAAPIPSGWRHGRIASRPLALPAPALLVERGRIERRQCWMPGGSSACGIHNPTKKSCDGPWIWTYSYLDLFGISYDDWWWPPNGWHLGSCLVVKLCIPYMCFFAAGLNNAQLFFGRDG